MGNASGPAAAHTVLVVDIDARSLADTTAALTNAGYVVVQASSFAEARQRMAQIRPDVLVTPVRLGGFNGLHLVRMSRAAQPVPVAIVTHSAADPALQADAAGLDALFVVRPADWPLFLDLVSRRLSQRRAGRGPRHSRRWPRSTPLVPIGATLGSAEGTMTELSYGGARFRIDAPREPGDGEPRLPIVTATGLVVHARPVWTRRAGAQGPWWCGVEIDERDPAESNAWRSFVDGVVSAPSS